jgi:hypothetical protein
MDRNWEIGAAFAGLKLEQPLDGEGHPGLQAASGCP